jgi:hypothetical protein
LKLEPRPILEGRNVEVSIIAAGASHRQFEPTGSDALSRKSDPIEPRAKEDFMYAAIRQGKARTGMAEELAGRIKEGVIPIVSDVPGFMAYYVVYAPDDTVTAISIFNNVEAAEESNRRALAWIDQNLGPLLTGPVSAVAGPVIVHTLA